MYALSRSRVYNCRLGNDVFTVPCVGNITTEPLSSNGFLCCAFLTAHFRLSGSVYWAFLSNGLFQFVVRPRVITSRCLTMDARSDILVLGGTPQYSVGFWEDLIKSLSPSLNIYCWLLDDRNWPWGYSNRKVFFKVEPTWKAFFTSWRKSLALILIYSN
jgi:hypothetical protein